MTDLSPVTLEGRHVRLEPLSREHKPRPIWLLSLPARGAIFLLVSTLALLAPRSEDAPAAAPHSGAAGRGLEGALHGR